MSVGEQSHRLPPPRLSLLHRIRPGAKLLGLFMLGITVVAAPGWIPAVALLAICLVLALASGVGARAIGRLLRGFALIGLLLGAFQWWQHGPERAIEIVAGLLALMLAASAVTHSTAIGDMLDTIVWVLGPLTRFGVSPERVALAFSLAIRSLPQARLVAQETLQAAHSRGLQRHPRAFAVPFALRMVAHARDTGAALHARGLGDD